MNLPYTMPQQSGPAGAPRLNPSFPQEAARPSIASTLTLLYLFIAYSRIAELVLPIPALAFAVGGIALATAFATGELAAAVRTKVGILFVVLTSLLILGIPFSQWPGGTLNLIQSIWLKSVAIFFLIAGTIKTVPLCRRLFYVISAAIAVIVSAGLALGSDSGRFSFGAGTLGNPNDFAVHVLLGVPFLFFVIEWKTLKSFGGVAALAIVPLALVLVLKTGSRAGLLSTGVLIAYTFLRGSAGLKVSIGTFAVLGLAVAPFVIAPEALERYRVLFAGESAAEMAAASSEEAEHAVASSESREKLLLQSLEVLARNPVLGVGAGMFSVAAAKQTESQGQRADWLQTHNSFTQMASEGGVPAGLTFIACLVFAIRTRGRIRKMLLRPAQNVGSLPADQRLLLMAAKAVTSSAIAFTVGAVFGNYAYAMYVPILAGCGQAVRLTAQRYAAATRPSPMPARLPQMGRTGVAIPRPPFSR